MNWTAVATGLLMTIAGADALAQTVYRCGPGGREYSQTPCPAGHEVEVADPRSPEQQRAAQAAAAKDAQLARDLAAERHAREREAAARGLGPAAIKPAPAAASAAHAKAEKKSKKKSGKKPPADASWSATSPRRP